MWRVGQIGGADGLMRLLRSLAGGVRWRLTGQVLVAEVLLDETTAGVLSVLRDARAVGTHVSNETDAALGSQVDTFIELLGQAHGHGGGEMKLPARLLLERAGRERRLWPLLSVLLFDRSEEHTSELQSHSFISY